MRKQNAAENFAAIIKSDSFAYTIWRREYFDKMDLKQINTEAVAYARKHTHTRTGAGV